jgi:hypothetical protein
MPVIAALLDATRAGGISESFAEAYKHQIVQKTCKLFFLGRYRLFFFGLLNLTEIFNRFLDGRISALAIGLASLMWSPRFYVTVMEAEENKLGNPEHLYIFARYRFGMSIALGVVTIGIFVMIMLE